MSLRNQWQILCDELQLDEPQNQKLRESLEHIVFQSDRYIYEYTITVGGMGEIQAVYDSKLMRRVARKVLKQEHMMDSIVRSRFIIEGQIISQLDHPNILPIYDMGIFPDQRPYFTMPIMRGSTLQEIVYKIHEVSSDGQWQVYEGWTWKRLVQSFISVVEAVANAHSRGVVHRDIKPANVVVGENGETFLIDWGLAKVIRETKKPINILEMTEELTEVGSVEGTPAFMSPEQARGELYLSDERSDVYSLGAVLYTILNGKPPYVGDNSIATLRQVLAGPPNQLATPSGNTMWASFRTSSGLGIPKQLVLICDKAMQRNAEERYANAQEMLIPLRMWLEDINSIELAKESLKSAAYCAKRIQHYYPKITHIQEQIWEMQQKIRSYDSEITKNPLWKLQQRLEELQVQTHRLEMEHEQHLLHALAQKPDLITAHIALINHYRNQHALAENQRDTKKVLRAETKMRLQLAALPTEHAERKKIENYLLGRGAVSVSTEPQCFSVQLEKFEQQNNRLIPTFIQRMSHTPIDMLGLEMGSYRFKIQQTDYCEIYYPFVIERRRHWNGTPPEKKERQSIVLPSQKDVLVGEECFIPEGWFWFGHEETLQRIWMEAYVIQKYPVTNRQYLEFLNSLIKQGRTEEAIKYVPRERSGRFGQQGNMLYELQENGLFSLISDDEGDSWQLEWPVVMVDFYGAQAYSVWLSQRDKKNWRLPFEGEWEKAARGVDGRAYPWGDFFDASWCSMRDSHHDKPLIRNNGSFPVDCSVYGVVDMAGNTHEWTQTVYSTKMEHIQKRRFVEVEIDALSDHSIPPHLRVVVRGGGWRSPSSQCTTYYRGFSDLDRRNNQIGFRLVRYL